MNDGIKRNLFDELVEGMQALREEREGKMNKVIRKLAEQAMESTGVEELGGGYSGGYRELNPEKFAKLIIQECCDIIAPYNIKNGVMFDISTNLPPIYVIKKHFGVEE